MATILNRFLDDEKSRIYEQLAFYEALSGTSVPKFEKAEKDRVDDWWVSVLRIIKDETGEEPKELAQIVKLLLIISHGQGMVESGFSSTKWFVSGRNSLCDASVKSLKMIKKVVTKHGGADKVPITTQVLQSVKFAVRNQKKEGRKRTSKEGKRGIR